MTNFPIKRGFSTPASSPGSATETTSFPSDCEDLVWLSMINAIIVLLLFVFTDSGTTLAAVLPLSIGMVVVMITIIVCLYLRRQRLMREQAQDTGGVVVLGRRGNMVMMGVPANRANDMMVHAANQYGGKLR